MKRMLRRLFSPPAVWCALLVPAMLTAAVADDSVPPRHGKRTPPPEAYAACEGKAAGDSVTVTTPRGETLTAVCRELDGKLAAMPKGGPPRPGGGPPEKTE